MNRISVLCLVLALLPVGAWGEAPEILIVRAEEDWLADPDAVPPWKAKRLGERSFLTLGGEWRLAFESFENEEWGNVPGRDSFVMNRLMTHAGWTWLPDRTSLPDRSGRGNGLERVRIFFQLKHGEVYERQSEDRPPDIDRLDVNAAFVELRATSGEALWTLRLGRQELHYGAARLISVREGPNTRTSFDAALLRYERNRWHADAFYAFPNETDPGSLDNGRRQGRKLRGVYATRRLGANGGPDSVNQGIDFYAFLDERPQSYFEGAGREKRYSWGGRFFHRGERLRQDLLWTWQWGDIRWNPQQGPDDGSIKDGSIEAWTVSTNSHYLLKDGGWRPTVNVFFGYTTGDEDANDGDVQTFRAPYPPGRYFGTGAPNGPLNVFFYRLGLAFSPGPVAFDVGAYEFQRESLADGAYGVPGIPLRSPGLSGERRIGRLVEAKAAWTWGRFEMEAEAAHFFAGPFLEADTFSEDMTFLGLKLVFKY